MRKKGENVQYIINRVMRFDSENLSVSCCESGLRLKLNTTQARILEVLVENSGKAVSREKILDFSTQTNPPSPSGNMLNNNIRQLRHILYQIIPEEIIITLHGIGYMIKAEVKCNGALEESLPDSTLKERLSSTIDHTHPPASAPENKNYWKLLKFLPLLIFFISPPLPRTDKNYIYDIDNPPMIKTAINGCNIHELKSDYITDINGTLSRVISFLKQHNITCKNTEIVFAYESVDKDNVTRLNAEYIFIAKCDYYNDTASNCKNWYNHQHVETL